MNEDFDEPAIPGYRNLLIYCDESGTHGAKYYGFGSLWLPHERRGDLAEIVDRLRHRHRMFDEFKWSKVNQRYEAFYRELLTTFFERRWMMFHCLLVRRAYVDHSFHSGGLQEAQQKHLTLLLAKKIGFFARGRSDRVYRIRVDPLPFSYAKADEVVAAVANNLLTQDGCGKLVRDVRSCDSRSSVGIQLVDVLLGAVTSAFEGVATSPAKLNIQRHVAALIGWKDLRGDTHLREWKFNIWYFFDPTKKLAREVRTRQVRLKYPMPAMSPGPSSERSPAKR